MRNKHTIKTTGGVIPIFTIYENDGIQGHDVSVMFDGKETFITDPHRDSYSPDIIKVQNDFFVLKIMEDLIKTGRFAPSHQPLHYRVYLPRDEEWDV